MSKRVSSLCVSLNGNGGWGSECLSGSLVNRFSSLKYAVYTLYDLTKSNVKLSTETLNLVV